MPYLLNLVYLLLLLGVLPWLAYKAAFARKYRAGLLAKAFGLTPIRAGDRPCAWFHAVSVGEVLLLRQLVAGFRRRHPDWDVVISTTTQTGFDVARGQFPDVSAFYWPLDFTWAAARALRRIRPTTVVLAELELWPNFIALAKRLGIDVAVVNGRMSARSYRGYRRIRPLVRRMLAGVDLLAVQNAEYRERLLDLGAPAAKLVVTGSVKYDGVELERDNPKTRELAETLGIRRAIGFNTAAPALLAHREAADEIVWVAGSTQEPEERMVLDIYRRARRRFPRLRLILAPRHRERFDAVAALLAESGLPFVRRSRLTGPADDADAVVLLDTLGELGAAWGLADVAFVGGSFGNRGGQNMLEPAAYGAAVLFGPNTWNFKEIVEQLLARQAAIQVEGLEQLESETLRLLADAEERARLGEAARNFVLSQQGAAERTLDLLDRLLLVRRSACRAA